MINRLKLRSNFLSFFVKTYLQHTFITQYVKAMAHSLSVFDDNKQKMEYYEALSWGGLEETKAYKALTEDKRKEIDTIINNEYEANKNAKGTRCANSK